MTEPQSYREILEFLNTSKRDLLVIEEKITEKVDEIPEEFLTQKVSSTLHKTNEFIKDILQICENLTVFWRNIITFSGGLQSQVVIDKLKDLKDELTTFITNIGISLLKLNKSRPYMGRSLIPSLDERSWVELSSMLKSDENFLNTVQAMRKFQIEYNQRQINQELQQILRKHSNMSDSDKKEFSDLYLKSRLSIEEYFQRKNPNNRSRSIPKSSSEEFSDSQKDFDGYKAYMEADDRELARMKRTGKYSTRKRGKKRKRSSSS